MHSKIINNFKNRIMVAFNANVNYKQAIAKIHTVNICVTLEYQSMSMQRYSNVTLV